MIRLAFSLEAGLSPGLLRIEPVVAWMFCEVCVYTYEHIYICIHICMYICICLYLSISLEYIHIYIYVHVYIHISLSLYLSFPLQRSARYACSNESHNPDSKPYEPRASKSP